MPSFGANKGRQRTLPASVDFQLHSDQNNTYSRVAYYGVADTEPCQYNVKQYKTK